MKKYNSDFSFIQQSTPWGGEMHILQPDYLIHGEPIGDKGKWGYLAYVSDDVRQKIMTSGSGEMAAHVAHIKKRVGSIKKLKGCGKPKHTSFDF